MEHGEKQIVFSALWEVDTCQRFDTEEVSNILHTRTNVLL
jgi:hypothetical protein